MNNKKIKFTLIWLGVLLIILVIAWQAITASGVPDPLNKKLDTAEVILSCGVLVFREGLEAILVLATISATIKRTELKSYGRGILVGTGLGLIATLSTWFIVVAILSAITLPELDIQAATGLLAIIVLLIVMNWFFHKVYWTGWITFHTNRKRRLIENSDINSSYDMFRGFALLGFTAIYREGFEVILFLQQLRLEAGTGIVLFGASIGILLSGIVAFLTFIAHKRLPYRKMLILTGVLLGIVLLVMVGESVQEMQQANWLPTTPIKISLPPWAGVWFAVFPNTQGLLAQTIAALLVLGSYLSAKYIQSFRARRLPKSSST
jgi:high-affinity iron transporter